MKAKIVKRILTFSNKSAVEKISKELGYHVPEATVYNDKRNLQVQLKESTNMEDTSVMAFMSASRPLFPKPLENLTKQLVFTLHVSGSPISCVALYACALYRKCGRRSFK